MRTLGSPSGAGRVEIGVGKSTESGVGKPLKPGRGWRIIAGPELTPNQLHCATVPDGADCQWEGGSWRRIEAKNRAALEAVHFDKLGAAVVELNFCAVCGREDDLADRKLPGNRWETIPSICLFQEGTERGPDAPRAPTSR